MNELLITRNPGSPQRSSDITNKLWMAWFHPCFISSNVRPV